MLEKTLLAHLDNDSPTKLVRGPQGYRVVLCILELLEDHMRRGGEDSLRVNKNEHHDQIAPQYRQRQRQMKTGGDSGLTQVLLRNETKMRCKARFHVAYNHTCFCLACNKSVTATRS